MIPKQAIEKAIEGGWKPNHTAFKNDKNPQEILETFNFCYPTQESIEQHKHLFEYALDPTFWQALGKALGWPDSRREDEAFLPWQKQAHKFYNLILTDKYQPVLASDGHKDCDSTNCVHKFWEEILK